MPHSTNKELILGIMVGTTGISLLLLWYHRVRKPRTAMNLPKFLSLGNTFDSMTLQDEHGQGTAAIFQERQLQILEKLNELLTNMEELKKEIRVLKEAIPKLEEYIQGELGGKVTVHKISPQHRARKRRLAMAQNSATSNSSEEAESEGGCCKEDQACQPKRPADPLTPELLHPGACAVTQSAGYFYLKTTRPSAIRRISSSGGSKILSFSSNTSRRSSSGRRRSVFVKFQKSSASFHQQSRANFNSQEKRSFSNLKSSLNHFGFRSYRLFSAPKLSVVSCYKSANFFDLPSSSDSIFNPNEIEIISKKPSVANAEKYMNSCSLEYNKHFMNFETKANSSSLRNTVDRSACQDSTATFLPFPAVISRSCQRNGIATDIQESGQSRKDSLHPGSQCSANNSPAATHQHASQSLTSPVFRNFGFSSFCKDGSFALCQNEVTSDPFEDENIAMSSQNEDQSSPIAIPKIRSPQTLPSLRKAVQISSPTRNTK